ncbi:MAG: DUF4271 domain-containing protein [Chitinophagaceae bacterium]|nr:DUF4271 domain-containing protein [Chitinophagaceae bacterium]
MRRIILTAIILQAVFTTALQAQDDSSAIKPGTGIVAPAPLQDTSLAPKATIKKAAPVARERVQPVVIPPDTLPETGARPIHDNIVPDRNTIDSLIAHHPYYSFSGDVIFMPSKWYVPDSKDELFYVFCGVLFFLGILRLGFPKYFHDIFHVFLRPAVRQKQIRDQLQQAGMTGLLFNVFFVFSAALFGYLMIQYTTTVGIPPWLLIALCFTGIIIVYLGKYTVLKLTGWMFGQQTITNAYIFTVFLINKVLAVLLIPLMIMLAFGDEVFQRVAFTVSIILLLLLLMYRFVLSFSGVRNELKIGWLHLFLYVCGFEIIPVLLIYKVLLRLLTISL